MEFCRFPSLGRKSVCFQIVHIKLIQRKRDMFVLVSKNALTQGCKCPGCIYPCLGNRLFRYLIFTHSVIPSVLILTPQSELSPATHPSPKPALAVYTCSLKISLSLFPLIFLIQVFVINRQYEQRGISFGINQMGLRSSLATTVNQCCI